MPKRSKLLSTVTESVGIYGYAPTCHFSALARIPGYTVDKLDDAIDRERTLARVRVMRRSVYLLGHDLLPIAIAATRREVLRLYDAPSRKVDVDFAMLARKIERCLSNGPLPAAEIRTLVDPDKTVGYGFNIVMGRMASECRIVRATGTRGWRASHSTYARWKDWLPEVDPLQLDEQEAKSRLARIYVEAYGPVELDDLAWWTGWSKRDARIAADGVDLSREGRAMRKLTGVRLLPVWDVLMVAYRNRDRLFDADQAPFIYDRMGNATSVVLDRGRVVGVWDLGRSDDPVSVKVVPFGRWPERRWDDVAREVERIGHMLGASRTRVVRRRRPVSLLEAPKNRFLSPLS